MNETQTGWICECGYILTSRDVCKECGQTRALALLKSKSHAKKRIYDKEYRKKYVKIRKQKNRV